MNLVHTPMVRFLYSVRLLMYVEFGFVLSVCECVGRVACVRVLCVRGRECWLGALLD